MIATDPAAAPKRPDLAFLRRRARTVVDSAAVAAAPAPVSSSLDLSSPPPAPAPAPAPVRAVERTPPPVRAPAGREVLLTPTSPTVTLTRVQSGVGTLTFEAAVSAALDELRLGAAYQLRSGESSTVERESDRRVAPPNSRRPIIVAGRERWERLVVDLRQCRDLERLIVYAFFPIGASPTWGGTLITTTYGGSDLELPLETLQGGDVAVLMSLYNVRGEFVLRAEMQTLYGSIRAACRAYGYDRITWLDERTPTE